MMLRAMLFTALVIGLASKSNGFPGAVSGPVTNKLKIKVPPIDIQVGLQSYPPPYAASNVIISPLHNKDVQYFSIEKPEAVMRINVAGVPLEVTLDLDKHVGNLLKVEVLGEPAKITASVGHVTIVKIKVPERISKIQLASLLNESVKEKENGTEE